MRLFARGHLSCLMLLCMYPLLMGASPEKKPANPTHKTGGADWSYFRGSAQQGHAAGKLSDNLQRKWQSKTGGAIVSSAVIRENRIFVGSNDKSVHALSLQTGAKLWRFATKGAVEAPPTALPGSLVIGSADGWVYALNPESGTLKWRYETKGKVLGAATPVTLPSGKTILAVGSYDGKLHAIDELSGKARWTFTTENYLHGSPARWGTNLVVGGCDGYLHVISSTDGKEIRKISLGAQIGSTPLIHHDKAYVGTYGNRFLSLNLRTGETIWEYRDQAFPFFSSAALADEILFLGSRDRKIHAVDIKSGEALWAFRTRGKVDGSPVVCDGKVIVGSADGRLYILNPEDGEDLWSFDLGAAIQATPAVWNGMVVVGTDDGTLHAFGAAPPPQPSSRP